MKNNLTGGPRAHHAMKMNRILIFNLYCEKINKSHADNRMCKNLKTCEKHLNPVTVGSRPKFQTLKTQMSSTLCTKIVSFENQLKSKNPKTNDHPNQSLSFENRPMSEIPKTQMSGTLCTKTVSFENLLNSKNPKTNDDHRNPLSFENRPMSKILKTQMPGTLCTKTVSFENLLNSKNPNTNDDHRNPLSFENRPMSEILKTQMSGTLCTKTVYFENLLNSKNPKTNDDHRNPLSFENRPMSEILKTILMIPVIVLVSVLLFLKNGIFLRGLIRPVLIDMPGPPNEKPFYHLKNQSVGISTETNFARKQYAYAITEPISAWPHLLVASGKTKNPFFAD